MPPLANPSGDYPLPAVRRLRVYAFDPQASVELATAVINDAVIELPWESRWEDPLGIGPENEYLQVIDHDPASGVFYAPVDLNHPVLLAQNGLPPSEGRPQFHQQMVFAVAMRTIRQFERAFGRTVLWAGDHSDDGRESEFGGNFTRQLRVYPHGLREANAYYSPKKRALLFGYFKPGTVAEGVDANWVFTCLSQDIIAHETTHAILHGMQQRSIEPSNVDALAFHEAFADTVALLQHFNLTDVLKHQLAVSRGSLRNKGLLTGLAQQFGRATGRNGSLRYALSLLEAEAPGSTSRKPPLKAVTEAHERGGYLVAAIFDAFVTIYENRAADLFRLARINSGDGAAAQNLSPELVGRLASEAAKAADHVLRMCVRALDYLPPVDLQFGEYLRAIITADTDLVPDDRMRYRVAFVEAFKKREIIVPGCISMAPDSLLWAAPDLSDYPNFSKAVGDGQDAISSMFSDLLAQLQIAVSFSHGKGRIGYRRGAKRNLRDLAMKVVTQNQKVIHGWFNADTSYDQDWDGLLGMRLVAFGDNSPVKDLKSITARKVNGKWSPLFEIHSARVSRRAGPNGEEVHQLIIQMTQRRRAYFDPKEQAAADRGEVRAIGLQRWKSPDFWFRGGATIHIDLRDGRLLRIIRKRIDNDARLAAEAAFRTGDESGQAMGSGGSDEPFAFMHRSAT